MKAKNNLKFYPEKAEETAHYLKKAWDEGRGVFAKYSNKELPEATLPNNIKPKSKEHALYLFYSSMANYLTGSDVLFSRLTKLYENEPEMFDPKCIRALDKYAVRDFTDKIKHFPKNMQERWIKNSKLIEKWDDDPRKIVKKFDDITVVQNEFRKFLGFEYKQSALLLYWYNKYEITNTLDLTELNIPVDIHVKRMAIQRDICDFEGEIRRGVLEKFLRINYIEFFKDHKEFDQFEYDEQTWVLGSQNCSKQRLKCRQDCVFPTPCKRTLKEHTAPRKSVKGDDKSRKTGMVSIVDLPSEFGGLEKYGILEL